MDVSGLATDAGDGALGGHIACALCAHLSDGHGGVWITGLGDGDIFDTLFLPAVVGVGDEDMALAVTGVFVHRGGEGDGGSVNGRIADPVSLFVDRELSVLSRVVDSEVYRARCGVIGEFDIVGGDVRVKTFQRDKDVVGVEFIDVVVFFQVAIDHDDVTHLNVICGGEVVAVEALSAVGLELV